MLMQARHHFPQSFELGEASDHAPASNHFATTSSYPASDSNGFVFTDPLQSSAQIYSPMSAHDYPASQATLSQSQAQDWQLFGSAGQHAQRMSQPAHNPRKRYRPNDRNFSNDLKKSPSTYSQHLPTPTHTPTQPTFLDAQSLNGQRAMSAALQMQSGLDPHFDDFPGYAHSTPHSVSSYGHDSPATPRTMNGDDQGENALEALFEDLDEYSLFDPDIPNVSMYDDIYNATGYTSHPTSKYAPATTSLLSPYGRNSMSERMQAGVQARHVGSTSPHDRKLSPYPQDSPYASPADFTASAHSSISTASGVRQQQKREADELAYQQHHHRSNNTEQATISPKDAVLDYHEEDEYPPSSGGMDSMQHSYGGMNAGRPQFSMPSGDFSFQPPSLPTASSSDIPLYMADSFRADVGHGSLPASQSDFPAQLLSMETSASENDNFQSSQGSAHGPAEREILKPSGTLANRGLYACAVPGCTQRFENPGKLQKHFREAHHSAARRVTGPTSLSPSASVDSSEGDPEGERIGSLMTSAALMQRNAQAGPHRCGRTNPNTGKPCNAIFSRPYDLTRHEDTLHNGHKKKVRCHLCKEDKTFSRSDALTRHMRVVHPEIDFPGKHRKRPVS